MIDKTITVSSFEQAIMYIVYSFWSESKQSYKEAHVSTMCRLQFLKSSSHNKYTIL